MEMETAIVLKAYLIMRKILSNMLETDNKTLLIAALGTTIDAWCKQNNEDPIEFANSLSNKVREVNMTFGEIGSNEGDNYI